MRVIINNDTRAVIMVEKRKFTKDVPVFGLEKKHSTETHHWKTEWNII